MPHLKIRPINTGYVTTIPKEYLYHHSVTKFLKNVPDHRIEMPVFTFLVEGGDKLLLVDTGMSWTERANDYHHPNSRQPKTRTSNKADRTLAATNELTYAASKLCRPGSTGSRKKAQLLTICITSSTVPLRVML